MQIIIDIPYAAYKTCYDSWRIDDDDNLLCNCLMDAIANGTVVNDDEWMKKADNIAKLHKRDALNEVRAEIERELDELDAHNENCGLHKALVIIDRHLRGNSDADNERRVSGDSTGDGSNGSSNRHA